MQTMMMQGIYTNLQKLLGGGGGETQPWERPHLYDLPRNKSIQGKHAAPSTAIDRFATPPTP